jgi:hypothetical protein
VPRQKRERGKKKRGLIPDISARGDRVAPLDLFPEAEYMYVHLKDAIISATESAFAEQESEDASLSDILGALKERKFFDPMVQDYMCPSSIGAAHLQFIIEKDPHISTLYMANDGIVSRQTS